MLKHLKLQELLYHRRVAESVAILITLLLLLTLYQKTKFFFQASLKAENVFQPQQIEKLPNIAKMHLFGDYGVIEAQLLPKTNLDLVLEGVLYGGDFPEVIITAPNEKAKIYRVGQSVPGGATIKKILPKGVILEQNEKNALLPLKTMKLKFAPAPKVNFVQ